MYNFLTLVGIVCAFAGVGMLVVLLITLISGQLPLNYFGVFLAVTPFILIIIAAIFLTRRKT